jgi:hypothetical protein
MWNKGSGLNMNGATTWNTTQAEVLLLQLKCTYVCSIETAQNNNGSRDKSDDDNNCNDGVNDTEDMNGNNSSDDMEIEALFKVQFYYSYYSPPPSSLLKK